MKNSRLIIIDFSKNSRGEICMKRKIVVVAAIALVLTLSLLSAAAKANFSGTWALDKSKSEGLPPGMDQLMTIVQTDDKLNLETKVTTAEGEQTIADSYVLTGQETEFTPRGIGGMTGKGKRIAKWSADGNGIDVSEEAEFETPEGGVAIQATRKWTMAADGKTLTIELTFKDPNGTRTSKRTFVKK
jgi:hypothetical protein